MVELINDDDAIVIVVDRNAIWMLELAWLDAMLAELGHERAIIIIIITREYLHSIIVGVSDEQETSMMVEYQAYRHVELAISMALLLGADRELDSSITIKSIVSHLFLVNLSLTQRKEMIQAPNCSNQRDEEDMKLSHTRHETRERHQASKQATSNKKQQEPIDEGTKNSTARHIVRAAFVLAAAARHLTHKSYMQHAARRLVPSIRSFSSSSGTAIRPRWRSIVLMSTSSSSSSSTSTQPTRAPRTHTKPQPVPTRSTLFFHDARQVEKANKHMEILRHASAIKKRCGRCWMVIAYPEKNHCICDRIERVELYHNVMLHIHYAEFARMSSNTAKIIPLSIAGSRMFVCDVIDDDEQLDDLITRAEHPERVVVLFPSQDSITVPELKQRLRRIEQQQQQQQQVPTTASEVVQPSSPSPSSSNQEEADSEEQDLRDWKMPRLTIIVLDGTWSTARALNRRLPSSLVRVRLSTPPSSSDPTLDSFDTRASPPRSPEDDGDVRRFKVTRKVRAIQHISHRNDTAIRS